MDAIARLDDPFARIGMTLLRGTGLRLGELLDLELDWRRSMPIRQHLRAVRQLRHGPEFIPALQAQLTDAATLRDDSTERGWHTEVARHSRVITSIQKHLDRLAGQLFPDALAQQGEAHELRRRH